MNLAPLFHFRGDWSTTQATRKIPPVDFRVHDSWKEYALLTV